MKATESSNVESEEEEKRRKRSVPFRYRTDSESKYCQLIKADC